jgi:molecular chaperone GrpE
MMKKKTKDQAESKEKNLNKTTDNKQNTNLPENNNSLISEIPASGDTTETTSDGLTGESASADKVVAEEKSVEEKLAEMQDKYIRLSAEFDNYRKRTLREKMDLSKYAGEELLLKIIPIMDDFERALKHMDTATDCTALKNGIDFIYDKFSEFLKQSGIREIESLNSNFNVEENDKKGKVVDVVLKGYYLQDKVLRFSKVVVGE